MSNTRYIEIDSQFRNRVDHPSAADFVVPISISGRKGRVDAVDPVSESAIETTWVGGAFNIRTPQTGILSVNVSGTTVGLTTTNTVIIVEADPGILQRNKDYYVGAVVVDTVTVMKARIIGSEYMGANTSVVKEFMRLVISGTFTATIGNTLTIKDPTDLTSAIEPWIFVPSGKLSENSYVNMIIRNETLNDSRPVRNYQSFTHLLNIDTSNGTKPVNVTGIKHWKKYHTYSIRQKDISWQEPINILALPAISTSKMSFNFNSTTSHDNLIGSFIEVPGLIHPETSAGAVTFTTSSTTILTLDATASTIEHYYVGCTITIIKPSGFGSATPAGEVRTIISYTGVTHIITVDPPFSSNPGTAQNYIISCPVEARRIVKYVKYNGSSSGANNIPFPSDASDIKGYYSGLYLETDDSQIRMIKEYKVIRNSSTGHVKSRTAILTSDLIAGYSTFTIRSGIVDKPFTRIFFDTDVVNMLPFAYDNLNPFAYSGSIVSQQEMVCYEIDLVNLILPNAVISVGDGGLASDYPYIYVELQNISSSSRGLKNIIYSNNPNSTSMLFRVSVDDIPDPSRSKFIKIDGDGARQTIKFKPNDNLHFSVRLQNGEIFKTVLPEFFSPSKPNPLAQISAYFSIRRV